VGTPCADHVTPLYPQKLALTSPTGGGRSVGIVRSRTKATELSRVDAALSSRIYYYLYMFRVLSAPIIRSTIKTADAIIGTVHGHDIVK
jgi:hypothetical protein